MSWNIEILCVRDPDLEVEFAVPDVMGPTGARYGFEDATSVVRGQELSAARIGDWIAVIDVGCRLTGFDSYLGEISEGREVHVFRIADHPIHVVYRDGNKSIDRRGLRDCAAALTGEPRDIRGGESVAQDLLREQTGLGFGEELWDASYEAFALD